MDLILVSIGHGSARTCPPRSHQSATQGVSGRGKHRSNYLVTWGHIVQTQTKAWMLGCREAGILKNKGGKSRINNGISGLISVSKNAQE